MSRCFPYPPPGYEYKKKNLTNGEGEAEEPQCELELELGYPDKNAKDKNKKEKKKKRKEKNKDEQRLEKEKSEKKHKHKHHKHKKDNRKDKDGDHNKQKNKDDINKVLTRVNNGGHVFEGKNGVVHAKGILNKVDPESIKFSKNIEYGKCVKIYPSEREGTVQKLDKERKSEVESKKFAGIDGLDNWKCDMIDLSDKENSKQKVDENKQLESRKPAIIKRLKNGISNKTDLLNREGSRQKVDKDKKLESRKFAGTGRHENGKCDMIDVDKDKKLESIKFSKNIENGKCVKIYPSESEGTVQKLDKERKSEVESKKFAGIYGLDNGKCDMIDLSKKENSKQKVDENKQLESRKPVMIKSLKNGICNKTDLSNREGSRQKVDKGKKLESRKFAGTGRHENGKCVMIDVSGREVSRNQVDKDKKLEVELRNYAGIERLKDGKCDKTHLSDGEGSMQQVNKDKKFEVEMRKSAGIARHQNGKCNKIDPSASEGGSRQNMDKEKTLEVELKKCAPIGRLENGKCDEICKSDREGFIQKVDKGMTRVNDMERDYKILMDRIESNGIGKKRKKMEPTSSSHVESIERLENGKCSKIDLSDRPGSRQKVITEMVRDNEIAKEKEMSKDLAKTEGLRKKRKEMDTTSPSHGNGLWINLPVLTDKDKRSIKRPRIEPTGEVYCGNGTTVQEAKDRALGCTHESGVQDTSNAAVEKCIASACHLPVAAKTISQAFGPSYFNAEAVDGIPSRTRVDNHVQDFNYFYSVSPKLDWSDVDDQAWLFHSNGGKPKTAVKVDHGSNVWAQALHLQPNLYALPYVTHL